MSTNHINLYWLLSSHIFGLFPVVITYLEFKKYKHYQSLYMFFNYLSSILFSILYHTKDYNEINEPIQSTNDLWILLDHWSSSNSIVLTSIYVMSLKTEIFYSYAYFINILLLIIQILNNHISSFVTIFTALFICLVRYKIIFKFLCMFPRQSILTILFTCFAVVCFFVGLSNNYELWHSLWHFCIFISAGLSCKLRLSLYQTYYLNRDRDRDIESTEMRAYSRTTSTSI
jgi:hypothetical protein